MKETVWIVFQASGLPWKYVERVLRRVGRDDLVAPGESTLGMYGPIDLPPDSPLLPVLRDELRRHEMTWGESLERSYTHDELLQELLLRLIVRKAPKGFGGPWYGTKFDLSEACFQCGTDAKQVSPLVVRTADLPQRGQIAATVANDFLVRVELGERLQAERVSGLELGTVVSRSGQTLPWLQVTATSVLPPMSPSSGIEREGVCPTCGRDGYFDRPETPSSGHQNFVYENLDLDAIDDVSRTYECFGNSGIGNPFEQSHFAHSCLIVRPRVYEIFVSAKVRGLEFHPVTVLSSRGTTPQESSVGN